MIAARGRNHARRGDVAHQQVGKSAPRFEGTGMLQQLQLVNQMDAVEPEIGSVYFHHRSSPDMGTDGFVGAGDAVAVNDGTVDDREFARHPAMINGLLM
jgi:hypothetical protein